MSFWRDETPDPGRVEAWRKSLENLYRTLDFNFTPSTKELPTWIENKMTEIREKQYFNERPGNIDVKVRVNDVLEKNHSNYYPNFDYSSYWITGIIVALVFILVSVYKMNRKKPSVRNRGYFPDIDKRTQIASYPGENPMVDFVAGPNCIYRVV